MADGSSMRLQQFLARAGVASRRGAEELIAAGRVAVDGRRVTEQGVKVTPETQCVELDGVPVKLPRTQTTLMLNKPAGYVTTLHDTHGRPTVAELLPMDEYAGLFHVGRLDADTTGLLLFTTDGDLGNRLIHPRHEIVKRYLVLLGSMPRKADLDKLRRGITLQGEKGPEKCAPAAVEVLTGARRQAAEAVLSRGADACSRRPQHALSKANAPHKGDAVVAIEIHEGHKRQIRRMFEAIGFRVAALHRERIGGLSLGNLKSGEWRKLEDDDIEKLFRS